MIWGNHPRVMPDQLAIGQSKNLYVYALGNPCKYVDSIGKFLFPVVILPENVQRDTSVTSCSDNTPENTLNTFDREAAIAYAERWWNGSWFFGRNREFYNYRTNCANFVSQLLLAGGINMSDYWYSRREFSHLGFWFDPRSIVSRNFWYNWEVGAPWRLADDQFNYFGNPQNGYINEYPIRMDSPEDISRVLEEYMIQPGDLLFWDFDGDGRINHAGMVSSLTEGDILFTGNTNERFDHPLSIPSDGAVYIVRIKDEF